MNIWRLSSRWSEHGSYSSTILDIFWKHGVVFIYNEGHDLDSVIHADNEEGGDLIAVTDGHRIVGLAKPLTSALNFEELKLGLRQLDAEKLSGAEAGIRGFRVRFLDISDRDDLWHETQKRFCCIRDETLKSSLKEIWNSRNNNETDKAFNIDASAKTLSQLIHGRSHQNVVLYQIPVYQRPYAWGEEQLQRFVGDIIRGIRNNENMFIGTMQLSAKRPLNPGRGEYFQEVIDGQQRLSTCTLILKALQHLDPNDKVSDFTNKFTWIETRVSNGQMQKYLDETLLWDDWEKSSGLNVYSSNLKLIVEILHSWMSGDGEENSEQNTPLDFFEYLTEKLSFVVIETEAGLSKTLQIFNTINTAGLDLNGGDLFKVRSYEYFKDYHQIECFKEISEVYETIDRENAKKGRSVCAIQEVLNIYQTIIVGKTSNQSKKAGLPIATIRFATETFFERFFDTRFGIQRWENFTSVTKLDKLKRIIDLDEIQWIIKDCNTLDNEITGQKFDEETLLAFYLIARSRYSEYAHLWHVFRFAYQDQGNNQELSANYFKGLARLFTIYSVIFSRKVNEIHSFIGNQVREMFELTPEQIVDSLYMKIDSQRDNFYSQLESQFAWYKTPKNLLCRLLEWLAREPSMQGHCEIRSIFEAAYDIEHIQSLNDIKQEEREAIVDKWGHKINGLGNLMLLEYDINRSIGNKSFNQKILRYGGGASGSSRLSVPNSIFRSYQEKKTWEVEYADKKLDNDKRLLMDFIFGKPSAQA